MLHKLILIVLAVSIVGCGSTGKPTRTMGTPTQPVNAGIAKLVKFGILEVELADGMALKAAQQRLDEKNSAKNNAFNSLTGQGSLLSGFALSSVLGAGLSLSDFLSPSNIFLAGLSTRKEFLKHESPALFIEIPSDCNEKCAIAKLKIIVRKVHNRHSELLGKGSNAVGEIKIKSGRGRVSTYKYVSKDEYNEDKILISLADPEIFQVDDKFYYGGDPGDGGVSYSYWYFGDTSEEDDFGLNALINISEEHPELFTYLHKSHFQPNKNGTRAAGCRGNLIIENGKVEQMFEMFGCYVYASAEIAMLDKVIVYP